MPDLDTVAAFLAPHHSALAGAATVAVARAIAPRAAPATDAEARTEARALAALLGQHGWIGYAMRAADGGHGPEPDLRACCLVREALAGASPLADAVFALQCLGSMPVTLAGTPAQRAAWLPRIARGEAIAAFVITEPEAGSDVTRLATTARRDGDAWVLDGVKHLISNAGLADVYTVFAATDPAAGRQGISCFLVPADAPGCRFDGAQVLSAPHPLGRLRFEGCRVGADALVGQVGQGFTLALETLDRLRATVAAAACGMAERALDVATRHAIGRRQFGQALADFQLVQQKLAVMATDLTAARLLTYRAAAAKDGGAERVTVPSAMAKAFATEAAQRIVDQALQICGGLGTLADHPVERLYRAVRALRIYEGTTEVLHLTIARQLCKGARDAEVT